MIKMINEHVNNKITLMCVLLLIITVCGCGANDNVEVADNGMATMATTESRESVETSDVTASTDGVIDEPDIASLQSANEDVIGWLTVPGTSIDYPILQSWEEDDYYASRNADKEPDSRGALHIEMANMANMCDFNTVIHGSAGEDGLFGELVNFENPDFFEANEEFKIYLDGNELTYEIWAVLERDNTSLIRTYDFSYISGCKEFLSDVYDKKVMGKQIRGGWGDVDEYNFLVTLTADDPKADKQLVVIGALIEDKAGTIDRAVME